MQIRLDKARDTELLNAMREAGVFMVAIGYESPIEEELEAMNKRTETGRHDRQHAPLPSCRVQGSRDVHIRATRCRRESSSRMPATERVKRFRKFIREGPDRHGPGAASCSSTRDRELRDRLERQNRVFPLEVHRVGVLRRQLPAFQTRRAHDPPPRCRSPSTGSWEDSID